MTQRIKNYIKPVTFLDPQEIDSAETGNIIDTYQDTRKFDTIIVMAAVGELGSEVTGIDFEVEESDAANMAGATTAKGGEEETVGEDSQHVFKVERSKRYIRVKADLAAGEANTPVSAQGLLTNWAKELPLL